MNYNQFCKTCPQLNTEQKREVYKQLSANSKTGTKMFKTFVKGLKFTTSAVGTIVSFGAAGDTIPDLIFLLMDTGILSANINKFAKGTAVTTKYLNRIMKIKWDGNPENILFDMQPILEDIRMDPNSEEIMDELCGKFVDLVDSIAAIVGSLLATFIPSDAGITRLTVEETISQTIKSGSANSFQGLSNIYNTIPKNGKDTLKDTKKMEKLLYDVIEYIRSVIPGDEKNLKDWFSKKGRALFVPGGLFLNIVAESPGGRILGLNKQFNNIIDNQLIPNVPTFVKLIHKALVLMFASALVLQECNNRDIKQSNRKKKSPKKRSSKKNILKLF